VCDRPLSFWDLCETAGFCPQDSSDQPEPGPRQGARISRPSGSFTACSARANRGQPNTTAC